MEKKLTLADHKVKFLEANGFERTYESDEPRIFRGVKSTMEMWEKLDQTSHLFYKLYIHFDEVDSNYCNLYYGTMDDTADVFSERNLISELKKRGICK